MNFVLITLMKVFAKILIFLIISYSFNLFSQDVKDALGVLDLRLETIEDRLEVIEIDVLGLEDEQNKRYKKLISEDKKMLKRIKALNSEVTEYMKLTQNNELSIQMNLDKINEIKLLYRTISTDLEYITKQIDYLTEKVENLQDDVSFLELSYDIMYNEQERSNDKIDANTDLINEFPQHFQCSECLPKFKIGLNYNLYPSDLEEVNNARSFGLEAQYQLTNKFKVSFGYQFSNLDVKTTENIGSGNMVFDRWNFNVFSADALYNIKQFKNTYFINANAGLTYGFGSRNEFYNQQNIARGEITSFNSMGTKFGLDFSYLNTPNKNPIEFVFGIDNYFTFQKIRLNQGVGIETDLGSYLLAFKFGIRYNIW